MNDPAVPLALNSEQRVRLAALADLLIPSGAGLPSASEANVHGKWVDRVLAVRPDLAEPLVVALSEGGEPREALERWRSDAPAAFEAFAFIVSSAYFINPRVRRLLGYPGQGPKPNPVLPDEADYYLEGGILDVVRERGPSFRPTPEA